MWTAFGAWDNACSVKMLTAITQHTHSVCWMLYTNGFYLIIFEWGKTQLLCHMREEDMVERD